jgi:hypothetical protein
MTVLSRLESNPRGRLAATKGGPRLYGPGILPQPQGLHLGDASWNSFRYVSTGWQVKMDAETGVPETMIAFKRADDLPTVQSIISGAGSLNWERFVTNRWVFMHANPPRWLPRGPQAESFVKEAYAQLHGI